MSLVDDLYPHQLDALRRLKNGSILNGGVGSGKSRVAVAYYHQSESPRDVYVITTAKKRDSLDWQKEFSRFGIGTDPNATMGGVLHVDSWNNINRYKSVQNSFFIFDEQRLVGSGLWSKAFIEIAKRNHWVLLSATPGDTWLDYIPVFIANGFYKNRTEFKRRHVVYSPYVKFPKVDHYMEVSTLVRHRNNILIEMPYARATTRHEHIVEVDHDQETYELVVKKRWHVYENRPLRNVPELFSVMRRVVSTHPSRLQKIRELAATHARIIVFYNFNYELEILRTLGRNDQWQTQTPVSTTSSILGSAKDVCIRSSVEVAEPTCLVQRNELERTTSTVSVMERGNTFQIAEWNGQKHEPIPDTDHWIYLVQYTAGAEGWNCTATDAMVFYSLPYSYKLFEQAKGRIDRLNTPFVNLHYYLITSKNYMDRAVRAALEDKRDFNERRDLAGI